jgi:hypothetical protein
MNGAAMLGTLLGCALFASTALAQTGSTDVPIKSFTGEEVGKIEMPALQFKATAADAADYDKYYFFHRAETSFDQAFSDISECDALASGISYYRGTSEPYAGYYAGQYGIGGAIGGAIGAALADAIFGSSERRKVRRINMRNCLGFKGYQRFGLSKELWKKFNFEEGNGREEAETRDAMLLQQTRVASGPKPLQEPLEP